MVAGIVERLRDEADVSVVGTAARVDELNPLVRRLRPEVVLSELDLLDGSLLDALPGLLELGFGTRVLVLTAADDPETVVRSLEAGASGVVSKQIDANMLAHYVRKVAAGETAIDHGASGAITQRLRARVPVLGLSRRELEVLERVANGETNRAIASALFVSPSTVKTHFDRIYEKLGVHDRAGALALARESGLLGKWRRLSPGSGGRVIGRNSYALTTRRGPDCAQQLTTTVCRDPRGRVV